MSLRRFSPSSKTRAPLHRPKPFQAVRWFMEALDRIRGGSQPDRTAADPGGAPPIFIVGCGHSGTSLLLAVLGAHSAIHAIPEETYLAFDLVDSRPVLKPKASAMLRGFDRRAAEEGKRRWVEKTPSHIYAVTELLELRPDARILMIIRDGRDVACSIQDRTGDLKKGIDRWVSANRAGQAHWSRPNVRTVRYEDLISDFEATLRGILEFLGEAWEPGMASFHETRRYFYSDRIERPPSAFGENHRQYRNWQINQPLFDGRGRWSRLTPDEKRLIKDAAGEMLIEYGYAEDMDW